MHAPDTDQPSAPEGFWRHSRDPQALALQSGRRVGHESFLFQEVHARMTDRFQWLKPIEGDWVDQSAGWGARMDGLVTHPNTTVWRFRPDARKGDAKGHPSSGIPGVTQAAGGASVLAGALGAVKSWFNGASRSQSPWTDRPLTDLATVPDASVAMVWSNLWLHREPDPRALLAQWHRVLKPGGAFFFACLGPDSAGVLKQAAASVGLPFPDYADMHDLGDALVRAGFSDPVMEMEKLTLNYRSAQKLLDEWRQTESNALSERPAGLKGRGFLGALLQALENQKDAQGRIPLHLELVYGHAWRIERAPKQQETRIGLDQIGGRRNKPGAV